MVSYVLAKAPPRVLTPRPADGRPIAQAKDDKAQVGDRRPFPRACTGGSSSSGGYGGDGEALPRLSRTRRRDDGPFQP